MPFWKQLIVNAAQKIAADPENREKAARFVDEKLKPGAKEAWVKAKPGMKNAWDKAQPGMNQAAAKLGRFAGKMRERMREDEEDKG